MILFFVFPLRLIPPGQEYFKILTATARTTIARIFPVHTLRVLLFIVIVAITYYQVSLGKN